MRSCPFFLLFALPSYRARQTTRLMQSWLRRRVLQPLCGPLGAARVCGAAGHPGRADCCQAVVDGWVGLWGGKRGR